MTDTVENIDISAKLAFENMTLLAEIDRLREQLDERCPLAVLDEFGPVYAAIYHVWGERCSDFEPECLTCKAWAEYDEIDRLRAALEEIKSLGVQKKGSASYAMASIARAALEEKA